MSIEAPAEQPTTQRATETFVPHVGWLRHAPNDEVASYLGQGWFEHAEQAFLWLYLRAGDVVVDVGAHVGLFTLIAGRLVGSSGRVLSIEPAPDTSELLVANIASHGIDSVVNVQTCAVSKTSGTMALYKRNDAGSAFNSLYAQRGEHETRMVEVSTLDDLLERAGIDRVDFAKIDVEGSELDVLAGAARNIAEGRLPLVMIEFAEHMLRRADESSETLARAVHDAGYSLMRFDPDRLDLVEVRIDKPVWYENLFAVRDDAYESVRDRLRGAPAEQRRIAEDLIARGRSSDSLRAEAERAGAVQQQLITERESLRERIARFEVELVESQAREGEVRQQAEQFKAAVENAHEANVGRLESVKADALAYGGVINRLFNRFPIRPLLRVLPGKRGAWLQSIPGQLEHIKATYVIPVAGPTKSGDDERSETAQTPEPAAPAHSGPRLAEQAQPISVVICTYNPRMDLLEWTLDSLRAQTLDTDRWELIVVDNNSSPALDAEALDPDSQLPLTVVREPRPGLTHARVAGIRASSGPLLVFVDDDNCLEPDYLERAMGIADDDPTLGAFGGVAVAKLEKPVPKWMDGLIPHLGVRDYGDEPITSMNDYWGEWDPIGAGMVTRRDVAERFATFVEEETLAGDLGRKGGNLMSGEDTLFARCGNMIGYACSYQPSLRLQHHMKAERLTREHLCRTIEGHGRSFVKLERMLGRPVAPITGIAARWFLLKRLMLRVAKSGRTGYVNWHWDRGYVAASAEDVPDGT